MYKDFWLFIANEGFYAEVMLGIYEIGRVELLRGLFNWAYECSTQEYVASRQHLAEPDPLCLTHRILIKDTVRAVVLQPQADAQAVGDGALPTDLADAERQALRARRLYAVCTKACWCCGPASSRRGSRRRFGSFDSC